MKLYSIKNTLTERFNPPFVARDDDDAIEMCRKAIIGGRDVSLLVERENLQLHLVGQFDAETGCFDDAYFTHVKCLEDILLPEHINKMIAKMKEVKE